MRITATRTFRNNNSEYWNKGDVEKVAMSLKDHCCGDMTEALEDNFICLGEFDTTLNRDENVNIINCKPYPEGAVFFETAIKFCPFCSEKIEVNQEGCFKP